MKQQQINIYSSIIIIMQHLYIVWNSYGIKAETTEKLDSSPDIKPSVRGKTQKKNQMRKKR